MQILTMIFFILVCIMHLPCFPYSKALLTILRHMLLQHKLEPMSLHYVGIANVANTQQLQPQFLKSCKTVK